MLAFELADQGRKHVETHRHAAKQAHRAAELLLAYGDGRNRVFEVLEDAMAQLQQRLPSGGDADATPDAKKDRLLQLVFEQQNLTADRRLRHVQLVPRGRERTGFGDRTDDLEL